MRYFCAGFVPAVFNILKLSNKSSRCKRSAKRPPTPTHGVETVESYVRSLTYNSLLLAKTKESSR